jgi:aspartate-semialdehyde dehydrogenase
MRKNAISKDTTDGPGRRRASRFPARPRIKVGILGCTGIVGQQFVRLLEGHPFFKLVAPSASPRSAGEPYGEVVSWVLDGDVPRSARPLEVLETDIARLLATGARIFFSALPAPIAGPLEKLLRENGCFVFTNASAHRADEDVPILVPEINPEHMSLALTQASRWGGAIVAGPNCATAGLVTTLKPLEEFGLNRVSVTTFQAISGAGRRGLAALDIAGNVIPFIRNEEEKIGRETRKILGRAEQGAVAPLPLEITASCCRVPVREGHLMSIEVEFHEKPDTDRVLSSLNGFRSRPQELGLPTAPERPIILRTEEDRPQPILDAWAGSPERARGMAVTVGRPRFLGRSLQIFALVHNTVRGAAGTCLLNAELAFAERLMPRPGRSNGGAR